MPRVYVLRPTKNGSACTVPESPSDEFLLPQRSYASLCLAYAPFWPVMRLRRRALSLASRRGYLAFEIRARRFRLLPIVFCDTLVSPPSWRKNNGIGNTYLSRFLGSRPRLRCLQQYAGPPSVKYQGMWVPMGVTGPMWDQQGCSDKTEARGAVRA